MPLPTPADPDTTLVRIASRTAAMQRDVAVGVSPDEQRALLADLAAVAAGLRQSTNAIGASLAAVDATDNTDARHAGRHKSRKRIARSIDPLTRFAILRGTDKWGPHFYTPVYHELFEHLRELPIRLLEIGVGGHESSLAGGASLLMWADYFPHARIVGIDIAEKRLAPHPRVTVVQGSQEDARFLGDVLADHGPFDIVVDDGSHVPAHVRATFDVLFPTLRDDGYYVIEDVQTAFWPRFGGSPTDGAETMALARMALEALNHAEIQVANPEWVPPAVAPVVRSMRAYHNLLVFQKGDNLQPSTGRFDAERPQAAAALRVMEEMLAATPTAEGLAQLARTYSLARQAERATGTVKRGLTQWPDDVQLLVVGTKVARRWGDETLRAHCLARLAVVGGDDPAVRELLRKSGHDGIVGGGKSRAE
jgi:hypothetical protein